MKRIPKFLSEFFIKMRKIKIGISYSEKLAISLEEIEKLVDVIEISNLSDLKKIPKEKEWLFHFRYKNPFDSKSGSLSLLDLKGIEQSFSLAQKELLKRPPSLFSFHLGHSARNREKILPDFHNIAKGDILKKDEIIKEFKKTLNWISKNIPFSLAIENLDYHPGGAYEHICEPEFINYFLREFPSFYLLIDIAHSQISAYYLNNENNILKSTKEYLSILLLDRVKEVHLSHPLFQNKKGIDASLPITKVEKKLLQFLFQKASNIEYLIFEMRPLFKKTKKEDFIKQLEEIRSLLTSFS